MVLEKLVGRKWDIRGFNSYALKQECLSDLITKSYQELSPKNAKKAELLKRVIDGKHVSEDEIRRSVFKNTRSTLVTTDLETALTNDLFYAWNSEGRGAEVDAFRSVLQNYDYAFVAQQFEAFGMYKSPIYRALKCVDRKALTVNAFLPIVGVSGIAQLVSGSLMFLPAFLTLGVFAAYNAFLYSQMRSIAGANMLTLTQDIDEILGCKPLTLSCLTRDMLEKHVYEEHKAYLVLGKTAYARLEEHEDDNRISINTFEIPRRTFEKNIPLMSILSFGATQVLFEGNYRQLTVESGRAKFVRCSFNKKRSGKHVLMENWKSIQ